MPIFAYNAIKEGARIDILIRDEKLDVATDRLNDIVHGLGMFVEESDVSVFLSEDVVNDVMDYMIDQMANFGAVPIDYESLDGDVCLDDNDLFKILDVVGRKETIAKAKALARENGLPEPDLSHLA